LSNGISTSTICKEEKTVQDTRQSEDIKEIQIREVSVFNTTPNFSTFISNLNVT
jgi:hypothetical protein